MRYSLAPLTITVTGDKIDEDHPKIVISNHQTDIDWYLLWLLEGAKPDGDEQKQGRVKIIMKEEVGHLPIIGAAVRSLEFFIIKRNWEVDSLYLKEQMSRLTSSHFPFFLMLFPEGTLMNTEGQKKCRAFAKKEDRPQLDHVLLPRVAGFRTLVEMLQETKGEGGGSIPAYVYDVTFVFENFKGEVASYADCYDRVTEAHFPSSLRLLKGEEIAHIHVDVKKTPLQDIPKESSDGGVTRWLDESFQRKDKIMKHFITHQKLPDSNKPSYTIKTPIPLFEFVKGMVSISAAPAVNLIFLYALYTSVQAAFLD